MITPSNRNVGIGRLVVSGPEPARVIEFIVHALQIGWGLGYVIGMTVKVAGVMHHLAVPNYRLKIDGAIFEFAGRPDSFAEGDAWLFEPAPAGVYP